MVSGTQDRDVEAAGAEPAVVDTIDAESEAVPLDAPTVQPPFDVEHYAREADCKIQWGPAEVPTRPSPCLDPGLEAPTSPPAAASTAVPVLLLSRDDLLWLDLEPIANRFLDAIDGLTSVPLLIEQLRISTAEGMALVEKLVEQGVIAIEQR
jgi:hypothetical protein